MPIGDLLAQISGGPTPTTSTATIPAKRKANDELRKPVDKLQKTNMSRPVNQTNHPTAVDTSMRKMKIDTNSQRPTPNSANTTFKNGQPTPPPSSTDLSKPAKKGSFAEIMARGKAAQANLGQVGKIQHKPLQRIEKAPSKREIAITNAAKGKIIQKGLSSDSKFQRPGQALRNGQNQNGIKPVTAKSAPPAPEKKVKKAATATTGYAGTARPKPGGGQSTTRSTAPTYTPRNGSNNRKKDLDRYYATDEDEDEEEDDDDEVGDVGDVDDGYASDGSSDMEAGAWDVEDEERKAERIAKQEDAAALAEENRLKREKAEKRARLAAMAAAKTRR